jgi:tRNA1Val (adenine37-N6)-methyltransferase
MSIFKFKHFQVNQAKSAMKIGTDAMVLATLIQSNTSKNVLDIGTGTGVLSLMLAQRFKKISIDAIEINDDAFLEASENVQNSPFSSQIKVENGDFLNHSFDKQYDLIVSNPPFFENSTKSLVSSRNQARHSNSLPIDLLFQKVELLLADNGAFWIILPNEIMDFYIKNNPSIQLNPSKIISIFGKPEQITRKIVCFQKSAANCENIDFTIREDNGRYSEEYIKLTAEFHDRDLKK